MKKNGMNRKYKLPGTFVGSGDDHIPDIPEDPRRKRPSKPKGPPPENGPEKKRPPVGPPPAEKHPYVDLIPVARDVVALRYGAYDMARNMAHTYSKEASSPRRTWERNRLMIVLFIPSRRFE